MRVELSQPSWTVKGSLLLKMVEKAPEALDDRCVLIYTECPGLLTATLCLHERNINFYLI